MDYVSERLLQRIQDQALSYEEKQVLIKGIKHWQQERWKRLKWFHNFEGLPMQSRHAIMYAVINLIREQKERLESLEYSLLSQ